MIQFYSPKLSPIPIILKIIGMSILLIIAGFIVWLQFDTGEFQPVGNVIAFLFGTVGLRVAYYLTQDVKWVRFDDAGVTVSYLLLLKRFSISKQEITGYTDRNYIQKINQHAIILHYGDGKNVELINKNCWSFADLEAYVAEHFNLIEEENYHPKFWAR